MTDEHRPRLTVQQERDLVVATEAGDATACRQLVEAFLPAIGAMARGYLAIGVERKELIQEGVAGLLFAARRYDSGSDTPFWAYASFWVRKAMQELVAELTRPMALSDRAVRGLAQIRAARSDHVTTHGAEPTQAELSSATGFSPAQLESLLATERTPRGMEEPASLDEGTTVTVGDTIADPVAEEEYARVLDDIEIQEVGVLADRLDSRERAVLWAHYGLGQPAQTLTLIGLGLGVTAERVRQIEAGALKQLRDALAQPARPGEEPT